MTQLSPKTVSIVDEEITIDAAALAPKLGLSAEALMENMANGLVTTVAEKGVDEDAGRFRLTFRYGTRVWRVVMEADGNVIEDPMPTSTAAPATEDRFSLLDFVRDAS